MGVYVDEFGKNKEFFDFSNRKRNNSNENKANGFKVLRAHRVKRTFLIRFGAYGVVVYVIARVYCFVLCDRIT